MTASKLKILFFLRGIHYDRVFENFLRAVLERGHELHVALVQEKRGRGADKTRIFDEFAGRYAFSYEQLPRRRDPWLAPAVALRYALDYLRYLEPEFAHTEPLRDRARERVPRLLRALLALPPFRARIGRGLIRAVLRWAEAVIPVPRGIRAMIKDRAPDVVLVSPLVGLGSIEGDYVRAADALGIPTALIVASWDNLSNKGLIRDVPTLTVVWNQTQVDEAVRFHKVPADRVVAVGAHSFDHWFTWRASTTREEFTARLGLDAERPLILYVGSSLFISGDETAFIREWLARVRAHPRLAEVAVIVRPHPQNTIGWDELEVDEPDKTVVWPRAGDEPRGEQAKMDYFDSLFHSRVMVGVSTTSLVEAAILHRPALTLVTDLFPAQEGTLHFSYIAPGDDDGLVTVGRSWDEHLEQVADAIEAPERYEARIEAFLAHFLQPNGAVPAAPAAAAAVEQAAATAVQPRRVLALLRVLTRGLTPLVWFALPIFRPRQTWRHSVKAARQRAKRMRLRSRVNRAVSVGRVLVANARRTKRRLGKRGSTVKSRASKVKRRFAKRARRLTPAAHGRWARITRRIRTVSNMRYRRTYRSTITQLPSRDELPVLLNARELLGQGAEVGVKTGEFSEYVLRKWRGKRLISIDPWLAVDGGEPLGRTDIPQERFDAYFQETKERLSRYGRRSEIWRLKSVDAASRTPDASFDFVYIDARHDYESVTEDLHAWFPKVRPGGILAGDDYIDSVLSQGEFGVKSAVDDFFAARGIPVHVTQGPSPLGVFPSWVVEIPRDGQRRGDAARPEAAVSGAG